MFIINSKTVLIVGLIVIGHGVKSACFKRSRCMFARNLNDVFAAPNRPLTKTSDSNVQRYLPSVSTGSRVSLPQSRTFDLSHSAGVSKWWWSGLLHGGWTLSRGPPPPRRAVLGVPNTPDKLMKTTRPHGNAGPRPPGDRHDLRTTCSRFRSRPSCFPPAAHVCNTMLLSPPSLGAFVFRRTGRGLASKKLYNAAEKKSLRPWHANSHLRLQTRRPIQTGTWF